MDKIRETLIDIYPMFWLEYAKFRCDILDDEIELYRHKLHITDNIDNYAEITKLFRLYFFIMERSLFVLNKKCDSYTDILSLLTVFSLWCSSIDTNLRSRSQFSSIEVSEIIIDLIKYSGVEHNCISSNELDELLENRYSPVIVSENVKKKVLYIYLKIIQNM